MAEIAGDALTRPSRLRESAGRVLLHVVRRSRTSQMGNTTVLNAVVKRIDARYH